MPVYEIFTDGACSGNPGPAGIGVYIMKDGVVVREVSEAIGPATNNIAEYRAFIRGLEEAGLLGAEHVQLRTDSQLLYFQLKGDYKVKHPNMKPLHAEALRLLKGFKKVECKVVPREENTHADRLATSALKPQCSFL
ncbi:MAG: ribonuclease HI family protein [Candidatus Omnitrophica bacterium]|nr:ribonuclease HI family protein [Candidatus Omnitrophota bacterium]